MDACNHSGNHKPSAAKMQPGHFYRSLAVLMLIIVLASIWSGLTGSVGAGSTPDNTHVKDTPPVAPECGPNWQIVISQNVGAGSNSLNAVDAPTGGNVWAVGQYYNGSKYQTLIESYNGSQWNVIPSPNAGTGDNNLKGLATLSPTYAWAVGYYNSGGASRTLVESWNGSSWAVVTSPNVGTSGNYLTAVDIVSANEAWAVGYYLSGGVNRTLILRWNGTAWSVATSPNVGTGNNALLAVSVVNANDAWAVGYYNDGTSNRTLTLRWNGSTWGVATSPNTGTGHNSLWGVTAISANDVWVVGYYYHTVLAKNQTLIEHWNGSTWSIVASPNASPSNNLLYSVDKASANDVWAAGSYFDLNSSKYQTLIERWNGSGWSVFTSPNSVTGQNYLFDVAVAAPDDVWTVGHFEADAVTRTLTERYNPCIASPTPTVPRHTDTPQPTQTTGGPSATPIPTDTSTHTPTPAQTPTIMPTHCAGRFEDVPVGSTYYEFVRCLRCRAIVLGYPCGGPGEPCVEPGNYPYYHINYTLTRGQISKIVAQSAGFNEPVNNTEQYQDVPAGSTFYEPIWRLTNRGLISGYICGNPEPCVPPNNRPYFRPQHNVSRGQMTKIVSNAAGFSDPPGNRLFEDMPPGYTFYTYTQRLANRGIVSGYPCSPGGPIEPCVPPDNLPYFRSFLDIKRGQASKIVVNTFFPNCQTPSR